MSRPKSDCVLRSRPDCKSQAAVREGVPEAWENAITQRKSAFTGEHCQARRTEEQPGERGTETSQQSTQSFTRSTSPCYRGRRIFLCLWDVEGRSTSHIFPLS